MGLILSMSGSERHGAKFAPTFQVPDSWQPVGVTDNALAYKGFSFDLLYV